MKRIIVGLAVAAAFLALAPGAWATSLAPGTTVNLGSAAGNTLPSGSIIASGSSTMTISDIGGGYTATVNYAVYKESGGTLDFLYQVVNSGNSSSSLTSVGSSSFKGQGTVDVLNLSPPSGSVFDTSGNVDAATATRTGGKPKDSIVLFGFVSDATHNLVDPGTASSVLVVRTNATSYASGATTVSDGIGTATFKTFAAAPEPASLVLLGGCLAGLAGTSLWRRRPQAR